MRSLYEHWIVDNPMLHEAERAMRKFLNSGAENSRGVNFVALIFGAILYLWIVINILRSNTNVALPLLMFELILYCIVVPSSTYNALSAEFERKTWEALILTRLTTAQIVAGKISWRVALILAISALCFVPLLLNLLATGDLLKKEGGEALLGKLLVLSWGLLLCGFSLWVSGRCQKTVAAFASILASQIGILVLLPTVVASFGIPLGNVRFSEGAIPIYLLNPFLLMTTYVFGSASESGWAILSTVLNLMGFALFVLLTFRALRSRDSAHKISLAKSGNA